MTQTRRTKPIVLAVAGFDPSGGAGIIADIRTIESFGCMTVAAITSITFQNAEEFFGAIHQTAESVRSQIEAIGAKRRIGAVKIGMLPTAEVVAEVARLIRQLNLPSPVIDPVMESTSGGKLMSDDAFEVLVTELLPLARVVTPNIPEAEKLSGVNIHDEEQMREAAARIRELGARAVLIKGGHLREQRSNLRDQKSEEAVDLLDDQGQVRIFRGEWLNAPNLRGTGCMLSSAIASCLAKEAPLEDAIAAAKQFVTAEIQNSRLKTQN